MRLIEASSVTPEINKYYEPISEDHPMTLTVDQIEEVIMNMPFVNHTMCGEWNGPDKLPTDDEMKVVECAVIVQGTQSGTIRIEETEYRYGEWDISNAWNGYMLRYKEQFNVCYSPKYIYKADGKLINDIDYNPIKWTPSIHMPREAARIFLRVTDVNAQCLDKLTEQDAIKDGFDCEWITENVSLYALEKFRSFWLSQYGPDVRWMWVYYFELISKEEALKDGAK